MTAVTIELPADIYERLATAAQQQHTSIEVVARAWIAEHSAGAPLVSERERARAALRAAGLLVEPSAATRQSTPLTPAERTALAAQVPSGRPLSEIIIEERGAL